MSEDIIQPEGDFPKLCRLNLQSILVLTRRGSAIELPVSLTLYSLRKHPTTRHHYFSLN